jgi:PAS domain S-box-containing protein
MTGDELKLDGSQTISHQASYAHRSRSGHLPLRMIFILAVIGQLISAVGLVGYLSFRNGQKAVNDLAFQLRREVTARIERELHGYFATPHEINRLNADAFARGELDVIGASQGESQFYQQMVVAPTVAFVYCGSERGGEFFGVLRSPQDGSLQLSYGNQSNKYLRSYYSMDVAGDRVFFLRQATRPFDARQRPWYKRAMTVERPVWTDVYIAFTTGLPNITAALPVYDRSGRRLLGVCATDVVLPEEFRTFLRDLEIGKNGQAFVIDRQGNLISDSTNEPLMTGEDENAKLLPATASKAPLVRETAQYLLNQVGSFQSITQSQQLEFYRAGQRQFLQVVPFRDRYGLDWLIVVVVPESDFMGQINTNTKNTVLLCLVTVGLAIAIGILTSRWITRPILRVSHASNQLAQGNLDQYVEPSPIAEINTLAGSFNTMSGQLKQSFDALRQSEAINRAFVTTIPDLMIRVKGDGTYLDIIGGDRLRRIYDINHLNVGSTVQASLPPDLAKLRMHYIQQALATGELQVYEHRITLDGRTQDEEVRVLVMAADEVLIMVRDITDRKQAEDALRIAEENYRSIFENALEGIFQSSPAGRFINVNPALAKIYGYDSPMEMIESITNIGKQIYVDPEKRIEFRKLLARHGTVKDFEYRCYCKDSSIIWTQIDARAVRDSNGSVLYYEGIVQDITDRKHREDELRRQLEELKIEIDQKKRETEVITLTESSYFREVQQEIANVNLDEFWS